METKTKQQNKHHKPRIHRQTIWEERFIAAAIGIETARNEREKRTATALYNASLNILHYQYGYNVGDLVQSAINAIKEVQS